MKSPTFKIILFCLLFSGFSPSVFAQTPEEKIDQLFGIDEVSYNIKEGEIHLAYDAANINLDGIEEVIRKHGADVHDDWWTHTKESYYKFVDQNVKDNAAHKPWSCHKVPPGASRIK